MISWLLGGIDPAAGELRWAASSGTLLLAVGVALATLVLATLGAPKRQGRFTQALLLVPALLALCLMAASPEWVEDQGHELPGRFVIVVDDSLSMQVREADRPRSASVPEILETIGHPDAERFLMGSELSSGALPGFRAPGTDLGATLAALTDRFAGEKLSGIALITDGIDRGDLRRSWLDGQGIAPLKLPGPLTLYGVGQASSLVDLAIDDLSSGGFAFIRAPFTLTVSLNGQGFEGRRVPVTLTRDGAFEGKREVMLDAHGRGSASFEVTPAKVGRITYEASVPISDNDAVPANNVVNVVVRVVRDRMRVLQVCGSPSSDEKFMRLFLKQDPAVDLVSFFILRTDADMNAGYASEELSLIPFPYDKLFSSDLWTFDLVIFQNFDYAPYFRWDSDELLRNIADYVRKGGALVMIGGDRSFDLGRYANTAIAEILPVRLGVPGDPVNLERFQPQLGEAGRRHPITALSMDPAESEAIWKGLAPLDGMNLSLGAVPGAAVLLSHPTLKTREGAAMPVVAIRSVERGRSMAFMGDSSWRWSFAEAARGHGNQAYLRFWKNAMRWLVGDPDAQRLIVETSQENYHVGEEIRLVARVRDLGFKPLPGVTLSGKVEGPSITSGSLDKAPPSSRLAGAEEEEEKELASQEIDLQTGSFEGQSNAEGEWVATFRATSPGAHRVKIKARQGDAQSFAQAETVFAVSARDPEFDDIIPDTEFLAALAEQAGGRFDPAGAARPPLEDLQAGRRVEDVRVTPLWSAPILAILVGLFGSLSWWVRRRGGGR